MCLVSGERHRNTFQQSTEQIFLPLFKETRKTFLVFCFQKFPKLLKDCYSLLGVFVLCFNAGVYVLMISGKYLLVVNVSKLDVS